MSKILITGSTGLIGTAVTKFFREQGHDVIRLVRPDSKGVSASDKTISWDPENGFPDTQSLEGFDVVIHLAGASIASRWTEQYKKTIYESRVKTTRLLVQALSSLKKPPAHFFCASAVGIYGNNDGREPMTEFSPRASGFLADVCADWEVATKPLEACGTRVVNLRMGVVFSRAGGALAKMLPPFLLGLGGPIGNGRQMMSWIALDEIPFITEYLIKHPEIRGPVNGVSPHPVSNAEFTSALSKVIKRPAFFPLPSFVVKILFGEMGEELLLGGASVIPAQLTKHGYSFRYPEIKGALEHVIHE